MSIYTDVTRDRALPSGGSAWLAAVADLIERAKAAELRATELRVIIAELDGREVVRLGDVLTARRLRVQAERLDAEAARLRAGLAELHELATPWRFEASL